MRILRTRDKYEGLDKEIAQALINGQRVEGRDGDRALCLLLNYDAEYATENGGRYFVVRLEPPKQAYWTDDFAPTYDRVDGELRPTKDTPVDTLLLVWDGEPEDRPDDASGVKAYFACVEGMYGDIIKCWWGGTTSETATCKTPWDHAIILKYPDGSKPGGTHEDIENT